MLKIENLQAAYGSSQVLFGIDLVVDSGEVVALLGRNGMGKTTTIKTIMGIMKPAGGRIEFDGAEINGMASYRIARLGLGLVPEGRQIFPNLTVRENLVSTAANRRDVKEPWSIDRVFDMFPQLASRRNSMGNLLSGGEQQMLAVGRALMTNPQLLILDEATEGLAPLIRLEIWNCLARIRESGLSILVVDKNIAELEKLADRNYVLEKGKVVWTGTSAELKNDKDMQHRYLGV